MFYMARELHSFAGILPIDIFLFFLDQSQLIFDIYKTNIYRLYVYKIMNTYYKFTLKGDEWKYFILNKYIK